MIDREGRMGFKGAAGQQGGCSLLWEACRTGERRGDKASGRAQGSTSGGVQERPGRLRGARLSAGHGFHCVALPLGGRAVA